MSTKRIIKQVRKGGSINGEVTNLVVTIPANSGIELGDYVEVTKVE